MRYRARRVIVKARVVKLKGVESQAIAAHLRYLQREGVTLDGNRGHVYSGTDDEADAKAFGERGREDRHQFRFIVAAEDGVALGDLKPLHAPSHRADGKETSTPPSIGSPSIITTPGTRIPMSCSAG